MRTQMRLITFLVLLGLFLTACGQSAQPAATSAPAKPAEAKPTEAAKPAAPAAQPAATSAAPAAAKPTEAPAAAKPAAPVAVSNPPTSPEMVDSIDLTGKNVEVVYWHNRPQKDQELLQS